MYTNLGGHGVAAVLHGAGPGPVVELYSVPIWKPCRLLRPQGLPYASVNPGVMHACGHDIHMTTALGTCSCCATKRRTGRVRSCLWASLREIVAGAKAMLADPNFQHLVTKIGKPSLSLALHDASDLPAGDVAVGSGFVTANADAVDITLFGQGGHGSQPQETVDPVVMGAETVLALQTIVSRRLPPGARAVVNGWPVHRRYQTQYHSAHGHVAFDRALIRANRARPVSSVIQRIATGIRRPTSDREPPRCWPRGILLTPGRQRPGLGRPFAPQLRGHSWRYPRPRGLSQHGRGGFWPVCHCLCLPGGIHCVGAVAPQTFARSAGQGLPGLHSDGWAPDPERTVATGIRVMTEAILAGLRNGG